MTRSVLQALWSHWRRNPLQLVTLLVGVALSTALWSGVQAINAEAKASYARAADVAEAVEIERVVRHDGQSFDLSEFVALRRMGWLVSPLLEGTIAVAGNSFQIVGIEPLTFPGRLPEASRQDQEPTLMFGARPVAFAHPQDTDALSILDLDVQSDPTRPKGTVLLDISEAEKLLQGKGRISRLLLRSENVSGREALPDEYRLQKAGVQTDVARLTQSFHLNLTAFGLLSFAVGIFIVYGAVGLAFEQRRSVFRTLRALGVPLVQLLSLLVLELGLFALVAGTIGVSLGYFIAAALLPDVAATLRGLYGAEITGQLALRPIWWFSGLGMAIGGTAIAAAAALYKLSTMPLLSYNHPRAMRVSSAGAGARLAGAAVCLFIAGTCISLFGEGLLAGFALLACLLIGGAFCLPWVLAKCLSGAQALSQGPVTQWFWADSRQQLPGLSMALMALLLAMSANIGVSTMVSSFRLTFVDYLDQRLSSELYINAKSASQAYEIEEYINSKGGIVLPIVSQDIRMGGLPAEVYGIVDHATYRENWPILSAQPDVWNMLAQGEGALVNEQLARRQDLGVGDRLENGDVLLGIYSDYGNSSGQIILAEKLFFQRYPDTPVLRFGVRTDDPDGLAEDLAGSFDLNEGSIINQLELKEFSVGVFERTFAVTAALNVLTLSVAGVALFISLLTLATMRLPQVAPVWALGLTRRTLSQLEVLRALCLAALTTVLAIPLGLMLAWVLLAVVNVEAFGWRLPMYLFPKAYAQLAVLALIAAAIAAVWPAIRLARTEPQMLLKVFSNER